MDRSKVAAVGVLDAESTGEMQVFEKEVEVPGDYEVVIRVVRAGVAFGDVMRCRNMLIKIDEYPFVPGYDVAGVIEETGSEVVGFKKGDRVTAFCSTGGYCQKITIGAFLVHKIPEGIGFNEAVALNLNYVTAYQMLTRVAKVRTGWTVLVHSAAGGVGSALLQLSGHLGLRVYGTASTAKLEFVRSMGAVAIDYTTEDFCAVLMEKEPGGVDAAFEALGLESAFKTRGLVRKRGRLVLFGYLGMQKSPLVNDMIGFVKKVLKLRILRKGRKVSQYGIDPVSKNRWYHEDLETLFRFAAEKKIAPVIYKVLPLQEAGKAQELLLTRKVAGKVLLDCEL